MSGAGTPAGFRSLFANPTFGLDRTPDSAASPCHPVFGRYLSMTEPVGPRRSRSAVNLVLPRPVHHRPRPLAGSEASFELRQSSMADLVAGLSPRQLQDLGSTVAQILAHGPADEAPSAQCCPSWWPTCSAVCLRSLAAFPLLQVLHLFPQGSVPPPPMSAPAGLFAAQAAARSAVAAASVPASMANVTNTNVEQLMPGVSASARDFLDGCVSLASRLGSRGYVPTRWASWVDFSAWSGRVADGWLRSQSWRYPPSPGFLWQRAALPVWRAHLCHTWSSIM
jgi:hypothetical protein